MAILLTDTVLNTHFRKVQDFSVLKHVVGTQEPLRGQSFILAHKLLQNPNTELLSPSPVHLPSINVQHGFFCLYHDPTPFHQDGCVWNNEKRQQIKLVVYDSTSNTYKLKNAKTDDGIPVMRRQTYKSDDSSWIKHEYKLFQSDSKKEQGKSSNQSNCYLLEYPVLVHYFKPPSRKRRKLDSGVASKVDDRQHTSAAMNTSGISSIGNGISSIGSSSGKDSIYSTTPSTPSTPSTPNSTLNYNNLYQNPLVATNKSFSNYTTNYMTNHHHHLHHHHQHQHQQHHQMNPTPLTPSSTALLMQNPYIPSPSSSTSYSTPPSNTFSTSPSSSVSTPPSTSYATTQNNPLHNNSTTTTTTTPTYSRNYQNNFTNNDNNNNNRNPDDLFTELSLSKQSNILTTPYQEYLKMQALQLKQKLSQQEKKLKLLNDPKTDDELPIPPGSPPPLSVNNNNTASTENIFNISDENQQAVSEQLEVVSYTPHFAFSTEFTNIFVYFNENIKQIQNIIVDLNTYSIDRKYTCYFDGTEVSCQLVAPGFLHCTVPPHVAGIFYFWILEKVTITTQSDTSSSSLTTAVNDELTFMSSKKHFFYIPSDAQGTLSLTYCLSSIENRKSVLSIFRHTTKQLDLSSNNLSDLSFLDGFYSLEVLILDNNKITSQDSQFPILSNLQHLSITANLISDITLFLDEIEHSLPKIKRLNTVGNECCPYFSQRAHHYYNYRIYIISRLRSLEYLDFSPATDEEKKHASCIIEPNQNGTTNNNNNIGIKSESNNTNNTNNKINISNNNNNNSSNNNSKAKFHMSMFNKSAKNNNQQPKQPALLSTFKSTNNSTTSPELDQYNSFGSVSNFTSSSSSSSSSSPSSSSSVSNQQNFTSNSLLSSTIASSSDFSPNSIPDMSEMSNPSTPSSPSGNHFQFLDHFKWF
eukprot:TRINITY_DN4506_c1_g2_i1.p1 TRINITY_DN4506_c1_g2~~TRINITY_DN4506_c1_g2_i1.p1  ORF type:complete len:919 (-),score=254.25 TRINITY_DN4506_c1_g2_i1:155-2911(-)